MARSSVSLLAIFIGLTLLLGRSSLAQSLPHLAAGYRVHQSVVLRKQIDGVDGLLRLLEDERVTPALRRLMWHSNSDPLPFLDERRSQDLALLHSFTDLPARGARLQLIDSDGNVVDEEDFDAPLGKIEKAVLRRGASFLHMVTIDNTIGWGPYAGPVTHVIAADGAKLSRETAIDDEDGSSVELRLVSAIRYGWRLVQSKPRGNPEFLVVSCRVVADTAAPETINDYARFYIDRSEWHYRHRSEPGCWEDPAGTERFPPRAKFPKPR